jgi:hypothetical protein
MLLRAIQILTVENFFFMAVLIKKMTYLRIWSSVVFTLLVHGRWLFYFRLFFHFSLFNYLFLLNLLVFMIILDLKIDSTLLVNLSSKPLNILVSVVVVVIYNILRVNFIDLLFRRVRCFMDNLQLFLTPIYSRVSFKIFTLSSVKF